MAPAYTQANINKVEAVQRRAALCVTDDYSSYNSVTQMINSLGWRSLEQKRADARLIMFYKIVYGLVAIHLPTHIQRQVRMNRTMHPMHFIQIQTTANYYKYSFFPLAAVQWNNLHWPSQAVLFIQVNHLQPKPYHAINPDKMFLSFFNFLLLLTNTILLFVPY